MTEAPAPSSGRDEDPASGGTPGGTPPGGDHAGKRDARRARKLARGFAEGGPLDQALPGPGLTRALDQASGPARRCEGAGDDEVFGMLGRWEASEAWCAAGKLGVIRALIGRRARPGYEPAAPGALPGVWQEGLTQEVSNELGVSARAADALIGLAADLEERLTLTAAALAAGVISLAKARIIHEVTAVLDDAHAAAAETLIASQLAGKTPGQIANLIARAVVKVDPEGARKRREKAQREDARVRFWREHAGTAALAAFGLPPDEALAANQNIQDKALEYKAAGVPGSMDRLRVRAFLDAINGTSSLPAPSPEGTGQTGTGETGTGETGTGETGTGETDGLGQDGAGQDSTSETGGPGPDGTGGADGTGGTGGPGSGGNGPSRPGGDPDGSGPAGTGGAAAGLAASTMLTIPLATLLGLAERPGDAYGWGALDPALARHLAASAARNPRSTWCLTITDELGRAIGHGCAKPVRTRRKPGRDGAVGNHGPTPHPGTTCTRDGPAVTFTPAGDHGPTPDGGYGTWHLTISGRAYTVTLIPIPVTDCDHRYETAGYRPGALLRHLVEVRDGQCTQPTCARAARRCDFEHAVPYDQGGRTCGCNGGCRCRRDHKVKQSPGWKVTQPKPGYHQWTTPSGRTYTTEPMRYPI
jgi:hypothetical protein